MKTFAVVIVVVILGIGGFLLLSHHSPATTKTVGASGCSTEQFAEGSSGSCVSDIQTLVNFMETDDLTECAFTNAARLPMNGTYDAATKQQVSSVQTWLNCYNRQEDIPATTTVNGIVGSATWSELCTYAYQYPKQNSSSTSPYAAAAVVAGKQAGC